MSDQGERITEQTNPASARLSELSAAEIVALMNEEDHKVPEAVGEVLGDVARAVEVVVERLANGGRLFYVGAGTSGRLGVLDASECPPTFGVSPELVQAVIAGGPKAIFSAREAAEDDQGAGAEELQRRGVGDRDAVVGLSASGATPYVIGAVRWAGERGAATIGVSCNPDGPLRDVCQVFICPVVGPEIIAGSTRLKCGTAQKLVLNMISTATMVRLGRVQGNLMVDLRPTSAKLRDRAIRIIQQLTGADRHSAERALDQADGNVREAIDFLRGCAGGAGCPRSR